jgi:hypothetical protein
MITEKKSYQPLPQEQYIEQLRIRKIKFLKKDMLKFNITNTELSMS